MTLDKAIKNGKEKRREYRGSKQFDCSCRNHGSCSYCKSNRIHSDRRNRFSAEEEIEEYYKPGYQYEYEDQHLMDEKYKRMADEATRYNNARAKSDGIIERLEGELATVTANAMEYIDQLTEFIMDKELWDEFMEKKLKVSKDN